MSIRYLYKSAQTCESCGAYNRKHDFGPPKCKKCGEIDYKMWDDRYKAVPIDKQGKYLKDPEEMEWKIVTKEIKKLILGK